MPQGIAPDMVPVPPGFTTDGGVDNQLDLGIFNGIDHMGPADRHFVYGLIGDPLIGQKLRRSMSCHNIKSGIPIFCGHGQYGFFIVVNHTDKNRTVGR